MFNLENKITWKELAPSLQSMFKALQSQITDNKNDITDINTDITDINNKLIEIDKSITNITNDIDNINKEINQIHNDITQINQDIENQYNELKQYIDNTKIEIIEECSLNDFLNLAPKIGYYQDDTIEVISKYNMNNPASYGQTSNPVVTTDKLGRTIMYYMANDGSYDTNGKYKLYYGYTENVEQVMTFINEPLQLPGSKNNNIVQGILTCDNDWIVLKYDDRWYIFDTNYSADPSDWTNKKDITSILGSVTNIGFKFIRKYGTIAIAINNDYSFTAENWGKLRIYRYSDLSLLREYNLENFSKYVDSGSSYWFDSDRKNKRLNASGNYTTSYNSWHTSSYVIFDDQELLVFYNTGLVFKYYNSSLVMESSSGAVHIAYNVPRGIFMGSTGTISVLTGTRYVFDKTGMPRLLTSTNNRSYYVTSYSSLNNYTYLCSNERDNFRYRFSILDNTVQRNDNTAYIGGTDEVFVNSNICWPSDSSLWGKWLKWPYSMWDWINLWAVSKSGDKLVAINKFQKYNGHNNIIEPAPGQYKEITRPIGENGTSPYYVNGGNSFTSNKMSDGSAEYWVTNFSQGGFGIVKLCKWTGNTDDFYAQANYVTDKQFNIGTQQEWNNLLFKGKGNGIVISYCFYNPIGDYLVVFVRDNHSYWNDPNPSNPEFGNRLYFGIVKRDGTKIGFDYTQESKYGELGSFTKSQSTKIFNSKNGIQWRPQTACCPSRKEIVVSIDYYIFLSDYTSKQFRIKFNDSITDFSVQEITSSGYSYKTYIQESPSLYYSGPKYGFMNAGNGWTKFPQVFYSQYPMIDGTGKRYTDEEFLSDWKNCNKYSMYLQSSQGLIAYIPNIPIFLGGYFSIIENPIAVTLQPNAENYIYLERDPNDRDNIIASATTVKTIDEGDRVFSKILLAKVTTDSANMIDVEYYRINTGYNDYTFNGGGVLTINGSNGQILTVGDNSSIRPDNNFRTLRVVDNDNDFNTEKKTISSTKSIFDTWGRYNSFNYDLCLKYFSGPDTKYPYNNGQNNDSNGNRNTYWSYLEQSDEIRMPYNRNTYDIFVSTKTYSDYTVEYVCRRLDGDDDNFGIVLGYEQLDNNKYNYIVLNRSNCFQNGVKGGQSINKGPIYWSIVFNFLATDMLVMYNNSSAVYDVNNPSCIANVNRKYCKIKVTKSNRQFECVCSANCSSEAECTYLDSTRFTYTVPTSKPENWNDYQWNSINKMVSYNSKIGVGVMSQPTAFKILNSELITNNVIYRIDQAKIYVYNNGWKEDTSRIFDDEIPPHSWCYNSTTNKLFHYEGNAEYTYINH